MNILGIDLGGCMSGNSAYVYIDWTQHKILSAFKEPRHKNHEACHNFLLQTLESLAPDLIAIDAPLSLPRKLIDPSFAAQEREGSGEICNPYLYRETDYYLYQQFGLRPMPPAGDRIGRLTARAVALLHAFDYDAPCLHVKGNKTPIYEVYPKQIAQALSLKDYKKTPQPLFAALNITLDTYDEHLLDALLCSFAGLQIRQGNTTLPSKRVQQEGWCYPIFSLQ